MLLPLDSFREEIGYNPWHFWQLSDDTLVPVDSNCSDLVYEHNWQDADAVGRDAMRRAIMNAEDLLAQYLGFDVAPRYRDSIVDFPRYHQRSAFYGASANADGRWLSVQLPYGYVQAVGVESKTLIGNANVTLSDTDSDGIYDRFTLSIATSVTDTAEIAVYVKDADRPNNENDDDRWRIQPIRVTISGGTATITGRAWTIVKPVLFEGAGQAGIDPTSDSNYLSQLAVYQRKTNANGEEIDTSQSVLIFETEPTGWMLGCCQTTTDPEDSSRDPAAVAKAVARAGIRDERNGLVLPAKAVRNATTGIWEAVQWSSCSPPDRVQVRYLAGYPLENNQIARQMRVTVARLAMAELDAPICACDQANRTLHRWQLDLAQTSGRNDELIGMITPEDLDNPLGTRRGHVYAWRQVRNLQNIQPIVI